jgi:hypothetical protein
MENFVKFFDLIYSVKQDEYNEVLFLINIDFLREKN